MKKGVIVAARMGSRRLPGKALLDLAGLPMIQFLLRRISGSKLVDEIVVATTDLAEDNILAETVSKEGIPVFRGDAEDVVKRYVEAAEHFSIERVIRVTGDCPFVSAETLDYFLVEGSLTEEADLTTTKGAFPVGIDYEMYNALTLQHLHAARGLNREDREHLTKYFYDHSSEFRIKQIAPRSDWRDFARNLTVDTSADYSFARELAGTFESIYFDTAQLNRSVRERMEKR